LTDLYQHADPVEIGGLQRALLTEDLFQDVWSAT
jgi:hypothetical protein